MNANELREVLNSHRELVLKADRFERARDEARTRGLELIAKNTGLKRRLLGIGFSLLAIERLESGTPLSKADRALIIERMTQPEEV